MIGVDWGTSSFRAYRLRPDGALIDWSRRRAASCMSKASASRRPCARRSARGSRPGEDRVLLSRHGRQPPGLARGAIPPLPGRSGGDRRGTGGRSPFDGAAVRLVPGLSDSDDAGIARGHAGRGDADRRRAGRRSARAWPACPAATRNGPASPVAGSPHFAPISVAKHSPPCADGTILGRMMQDGPTNIAAFDRGLARADDPGHLLHHLFGVRTLGLFRRLSEADSASYLSGLLIGHEVRAAKPRDQTVHLIGAAPLCALYARAISAHGGTPVLAGSRRRHARPGGNRDGACNGPECLAEALPAGRDPARGEARGMRGDRRGAGEGRDRRSSRCR